MAALIGERDIIANNESYRRLWVARLLSDIPFSAMLYTMLLVVSNSTGSSSFLSSLFITAYIAPAALLVTVAGAVSDSLPKALVLTGSNVARAGLCVVLAMWSNSPYVAYAVAAGFAITSQFSGPSSSSAVPLIVARDRLPSANSLNNFGSLIAQAIGLLLLPPLFLHTVGVTPLAIVCAVMFVGAALYFLQIPELRKGTTADMSDAVSNSIERFGEAWRRFSADGISYLTVMAVVLASVLSLVILTLLPRYANDVLGIPSEYSVFVVAPAAIGVWLSLRLAQFISERKPPSITLGLGFIMLLGTVLSLGFVERLATLLVPWGLPGFGINAFDGQFERVLVTVLIAVALGFSYSYVSIAAASVIQRRVPPDIQGRIFSAQSMLSSVASIPPVLFAGIAADVVGVRPVFIFVAIACGVVAIGLAVRSQTVGRLAPALPSH